MLSFHLHQQLSNNLRHYLALRLLQLQLLLPVQQFSVLISALISVSMVMDARCRMHYHVIVKFDLVRDFYQIISLFLSAFIFPEVFEDIYGYVCRTGVCGDDSWLTSSLSTFGHGFPVLFPHTRSGLSVFLC